MPFRNLHRYSLIASVLVVAAACGGSDSGSPVAPSPTGGGAPSASGATVSGTISGSGSSAQVRSLAAGLGGVKVSVEGTDLTTTTNGSGAFALQGVPPGLVRLLLQGAGASGAVDLNSVSESESISLLLVVNGSSIEVESEARVTGSEAQLEGKIASVDYAARTLVVGTTTVSVPESVEITNGYRLLDLTDLIAGARIHVKGTRSGDTVTASRIIAQQTGLDTVTLKGVVSDLAGTCPDASFRFGSTGIAVNRSTIFVQGSCAAIASGLTLEVRGLRRPDGSVLGTLVKFNRNDDEEEEEEEEAVPVEFSGTISGLSGPCPARRFVAAGREVRTTGSTTFLTPCATLANGQAVQVKGKQAGSGMVMASQVQ